MKLVIAAVSALLAGSCASTGPDRPPDESSNPPTMSALPARDPSISARDWRCILEALASVPTSLEERRVEPDEDHQGWSGYLHTYGPTYMRHDSTIFQIVAGGHYKVFRLVDVRPPDPGRVRVTCVPQFIVIDAVRDDLWWRSWR